MPPSLVDSMVTVAVIYLCLFNVLYSWVVKEAKLRTRILNNFVFILCVYIALSLTPVVNAIYYFGTTPTDTIINALHNQPLYLKLVVTLLLTYTPVFLAASFIFFLALRLFILGKNYWQSIYNKQQ